MDQKNTYDEKMEKLKAKREKLKAVEKQLRARKKAEDKKARTKLLIEIGEIFEDFIGREVTAEDKKRLQMFLAREEESRNDFFA